MRIKLERSIPPIIEMKPQLTLVPETAKDQTLLEQILKVYEVLGFGRNAGSHDILHLSLPLIEKNSHD